MRRIARSGRAEQTINKSRFIAAADYCADEREVTAALRRLAVEHAQAHHLAFAYRLKTPQGLVQRFHDAGEPSGTAGKPILQHLEGRDLVNVCIGVIRYYGGINLGTGGLARAYGGTAKMALDAARLEPFIEMCRVSFAVDYGRLDALLREVENLGGSVLGKDFGAQVRLVAAVPLDAAAGLQQRFGG